MIAADAQPLRFCYQMWLMTGEQLWRWRKTRRLTQRQLATMLQISVRTVQVMEGAKHRRNHTVPKTAELACYALDNGVTQFDGVSAR